MSSPSTGNCVRVNSSSIHSDCSSGRRESKNSAVSLARRSSAMLLSVRIDRFICSRDADTSSTLRSRKATTPGAMRMPWAWARSRKDAMTACLSRRTGSHTSHQSVPSSGVGNSSSASVQSPRRPAARIARIASTSLLLSRARPALSLFFSRYPRMRRSKRSSLPSGTKTVAQVRLSACRTFSNSMPDRSRARLSNANSISGKLSNSTCRPRPSSMPAASWASRAASDCARSAATCAARRRRGSPCRAPEQRNGVLPAVATDTAPSR